ncbi:MAG: hypothetical protein EOO54_26865 [Haliea sp.]|nr:MAG: hypothetical protein EOO54_26865 [Haliea sp.]
MNSFTPAQWQLLAGAGASDVLPLHHAELHRPFVYLREAGVFYCSAGRHRLAMSLLLAFAHGYDDAAEAAEAMDLDFPDATADCWLEHTPGAAFRSSVGRRVQAGKRAHLTQIEKHWFGDIVYLFDD